MTRWYPNLDWNVNRDVRDAFRRVVDFIYEIRDFLGPRAKWARSTKQFTIGTTRSAIPGCAITLDRSGWWLVTGTWTIINDADNNRLFTGYLKAGTEVQLQTALLQNSSGDVASISQQWFLNIEGNTLITLEIMKESGATGDSTAEKDDCTVSAVWSGK